MIIFVETNFFLSTSTASKDDSVQIDILVKKNAIYLPRIDMFLLRAFFSHQQASTQTIAEAMAATARAAQSLPLPPSLPISSPISYPSVSIASISAWRPGQSTVYHILSRRCTSYYALACYVIFDVT